MEHDAPAYGLWLLVILNSAVFIIFSSASSVNGAHPDGDWRRLWSMHAFITIRYSQDVSWASYRNRSSDR